MKVPTTGRLLSGTQPPVLGVGPGTVGHGVTAHPSLRGSSITPGNFSKMKVRLRILMHTKVDKPISRIGNIL